MGHILIPGPERPYYEHSNPQAFVDTFLQAGYRPDEIILDDAVAHDTLGVMLRYTMGQRNKEELDRALLFEIEVARLVYPLASAQARGAFAQAYLWPRERDAEETIRIAQAIERTAMEGTLGLDEILDGRKERIYRVAEKDRALFQETSTGRDKFEK